MGALCHVWAPEAGEGGWRGLQGGIGGSWAAARFF